MKFCAYKTAIVVHINNPHDVYVVMLTIFKLSQSLKHATGLPLIWVCLNYYVEFCSAVLQGLGLNQ